MNNINECILLCEIQSGEKLHLKLVVKCCIQEELLFNI